MPWLLKTINGSYLKIQFCPLRGEAVEDINRATSWKHKETAETVAMEFCGVRIVSYEDEMASLPTHLRIKQELRKLMNDPRYWRDYEPEIVRKVDELFNKLYYRPQGNKK